MSAWATMVYVSSLVTIAFLIIFHHELHITHMVPLQSEFTGESDLDYYANLFMNGLIYIGLFLSSSLWYLTTIQRRRSFR
jgi:hypothetical protein